VIITNNVSAQSLTTFGIDVVLDTLIQINNEEDFYYLDQWKDSEIKILGGGSNVLLTQDIHIPVFNINNKGYHILKDSDDYVLVNIAAGETWHDAVLWAVDNGYGGIENLSLIPGKCGAAPIQNIGAYGIEIKDVLHTVKAYDREHGVIKFFHNQECDFGYRTSNFKTKWKDKYVITDIILQLTKPNHHKINTSYGAISSELGNRGIVNPTIKDVSDVVTHIRESKLPDPKVVGNAGSFFKNPIISNEDFFKLQSSYPDMPNYPAGDDIKLAAGWLIDQCGWRGRVIGNTGTYKNQALVIVNHGGATGLEISAVAQAIQQDVLDKFGVRIEPEVNVW
jgi:UDP-N-acetylmuramate dehydrogenase